MLEVERIIEYRPLALKIAREFFISGAEREDVEQEALIGLWRAMRNFDPSRGVPFSAFAALCIRRQLMTALNTAQRWKHRPLTLALRHTENDEGELCDAVDMVADEASDSARIVETREEAFALLRAIDERLSPLERRALIASANGATLKDIHEQVGGAISIRKDGRMRCKRAENALDRARRKLAGVAA